MALDQATIPEFISYELLNQLYSVAENDLEFVKECVDLFMETVDERLPELDASVYVCMREGRENDWEEKKSFSVFSLDKVFRP